LKNDLVIIGGVTAGISSAVKARLYNPEIKVTVFTEEKHISYAGSGLPYFIGDKSLPNEKLMSSSVVQFGLQDIDIKTATRAISIYPERKQIMLEDLQTRRKYLRSYDRLIIATGAKPNIPQVAGNDLKGIFALRNIDNSLAIRQYFLEHKPKRALVIGAGYIGLEMIENLLEYNCQVTIIEKASHIIPNMDSDMASFVEDYLESRGVSVFTDTVVKEFRGRTTVKEVITDKLSIPADFVLLSTGVVPNTGLAEEAGIELGVNNAIKVNERMETSLNDIFAAGDCVSTRHLVSGREVYLPMGSTADKQGKVAGENAAGGNAVFKGVLGTGIARVLDMEFSRSGLHEEECVKLGIDFISRKVAAKTAALYSPGSGDMNLKLIAEKDSGRLIGAQIIGYAGAARRIDMLATAITINATVDSLIDMDLAYSSHFSPNWDPVLAALNQF
jgi:NADPH-dependent 2,4-dienoyl-CoA reductase/sulfur reductase-like enzyme